MKNIFNTASMLGIATGIPAGVKTMSSIIAYSHEYTSLAAHLTGDVAAVVGGAGAGYCAYKLTSMFVNSLQSLELSRRGLVISFKPSKDDKPSDPKPR